MTARESLENRETASLVQPANAPFRRTRHRPEEIMPRPRRGDIDACLQFVSQAAGTEPNTAESFTAFLPRSLLDRVTHMARMASPAEFIGLLAGAIFSDKAGTYVILHGVVPDGDAAGSPASVATTEDSEFRTRALLSKLFPDCVPIGWCHSHLGIGVFFSGTDRANQRTWTKPYHLGIVVDPIKDEVAVFRGPEAERLEPLVGETKPPSEPPSDLSLTIRPRRPSFRQRLQSFLRRLFRAWQRSDP